VRSGVIDFLRLGAVRFQFGPTATPTPAPTPTGTLPAASATPQPTPTPLASVLDLAGQTTLEQARARLSFSIRLPTYPADLGEPDQVFVQDLDGQAVVLVWLVPGQTGQVRLSLHILTSDVMAEKLIKTSPTIEFTHVNGREAVWTSGPYFVVSRNGNFTQMRLITGHVLIWTDKSLTYRLETDATVEEAVKMAESLK
jgi:hypothetical protein